MTNKEEVNHPKRYRGECSLECIEVMKLIFGTEIVIWFCMCNAFKYMWRFKSKNGKEDLSKADWYLEYADNETIDRTPTQNSILGRLRTMRCWCEYHK